MLLSVRDLEAGYGGAHVLRGVSLDVAPGEIVLLLGANGAGKTTTLRAISGVVATRAGSISFDGQVFSGPPEARAARGLGHVPEGRGILAGLTVAENLDLGTVLRKDGASAVAADRANLLELFPMLKPRLQESAAALSGGQQQMLALARALLARPRLVMLDEPSFGLAPSVVDELLGLVQRLRGEGTTFLMVEQHAAALAIADRAYVLAGGRTVLEAPAAELAGDDRLIRAYLGAH
ncbi:ABC transporter ATP-binding protein [Sporichthya polymorpha]|uniref:ABC transporter ATP-binding protein n=1 Tax=Sporichthya polymorpha TaxID=35751 RepID=UPI00036EA315|nr:ATP-binding cassette domain-containing protein [Sporichthya polymorpha]